MINNSHIRIEDIKRNPHQRAIRSQHAIRLAEKMRQRGYNESYPVTLSPDNTLVDGGHRLEAARLIGLKVVPYIITNESPIAHSLRCNQDGADTITDDVFDLAELCYGLAKEGWTGERIAGELGWTETATVTRHCNIKAKLHPRAWELARLELTRNSVSVNEDELGLVNSELTIVNWHESHFRAFLKHLAWSEGERAIMRAQVRAVGDIIARANEKDKPSGQMKKITADWISHRTESYAWYIRLGKHMRDALVKRVALRDRINLLKSVYAGVFGDKDSEINFTKFDTAVKRLNEKVLGVILYHDDALQRLPLFPDKSIALVITDPPYNVTDEEWDRIGTPDDYIAFTRNWLQLLQPKLADDYHLFFFCDDDYEARIEVDILIPDGWPLKDRIEWWNRSLPSGRQIRQQFIHGKQRIFHCGTHDLNWPAEWDDRRFDVQLYAAPNANSKEGVWHPTPKPQALVEYLIGLGSKPTDIVLDLFAGGGTTGAACAVVGQRQCILIEQKDEFCQNIEKRLQIRRDPS